MSDGFDPLVFASVPAQGVPHVDIRLKSHPEIDSRSKEPGKTKGSIGSDAPLSTDDLVNPNPCNSQSLRQLFLGESQGFNKLVQEYLAGGSGSSFLGIIVRLLSD